MYKRMAVSLILCLLFVSSCAQPPVPTTVTPVKSQNKITTAEPIPSPSGTGDFSPSVTASSSIPVAPTAASVYAGLMENDIFNYILPNTYEKEDGSRAYETIVNEKQLTMELPDRYAQWMKDSADKLASLEIRNIKTSFTPPSWQLLSTLIYNYSNDLKVLKAALNSACVYDIGVYRERGGYGLEISAKPRDASELFYMFPANGETTPMENLFTYAYLNTVYDNGMKARDGIEQRELPELLFPIGGNLEEYVVGDTWNNARDGGARKHTGTDINAPEGTELYAVVNGKVFDAGSGDGTGNYVVVLGNDGTQYHYYHMVRPTDLKPGDEVKTGDVVGYVGNTGNSTANHLHMAIITADGYFLNPYPYLKDAYARALEAARQQSLSAQDSSE